MIGIKLKIPAYQSNTSSGNDEVVSTEFPLLKSALGKTPPHFGAIEITVHSLASGKTVDVLTVPHGYKYKPQFFAVWEFDDGFFLSRQTFGTWYLQAETSLGSGEVFDCVALVDENNFYITIQNSGVNTTPILNKVITWRYYIFSEPIAL